MLVKLWMSKDVITVSKDSPMMKASIIMKERKVRCLPVVDKKGKLMGIITDDDIRDASPSKATSLDVYELNYLLATIKVESIMARDLVFVRPDETVEFAAILMLENKISALPVIDDKDALVGIITQTDVFKCLIHITGAYTGGVQIALSLEDRPGSIKEAADVIRSYGGRIVSILSTRETAEEGRRDVYIRAAAVPPDEVRELVAEMESKFIVLYTVQDVLDEAEKRRIRIPG